MNELNINEVHELCKSCGMCCDGTLFKKIVIKETYENDMAIATQHAMPIVVENEVEFIGQPCVCFNGSCSIYHLSKPHSCTGFYCEPLKQYKRGELEWQQASKDIINTKALRDKIASDTHQISQQSFQNWPEIVDFLKGLMEESNPEMLKKYGKVVANYILFRSLKKQMYSPKKEDTQQ